MRPGRPPKTTQNRPKSVPRGDFFALKFRPRFRIDFGPISGPKMPPFGLPFGDQNRSKKLSKIDRIINWLQDSPKTTSRPPKRPPRASQEAPRRPQDPQKWPQEPPRSPPDSPRCAQETQKSPQDTVTYLFLLRPLRQKEKLASR